ncbi:MAG: hypothetical protein ACOCV1_05090 [Bacillota bacterium]
MIINSETKRIKIKTHDEYQYSFSPSIIEYDNKILMAHRNAKCLWHESDILISLLDDNFNIIRTKKILNGHKYYRKYADPRFFVWKKELYICIYDQSTIHREIKDKTIKQKRRKEAEENNSLYLININPDTLEIKNTQKIHQKFKNKIEKNWQFFEHKNDLYSLYSFQDNEHQIIKWNKDLSFNKNIVKKHDLINQIDLSDMPDIVKIKFENQKNNIFLSQSVVPIKKNNEYFGIIHYFVMIDKLRLYLNHLYSFSSKDIGEISFFSKKPNFIGDINLKVKPQYPYNIEGILFICGFFSYKNKFYISYGYQDSECMVSEINLDKIIKGN